MLKPFGLTGPRDSLAQHLDPGAAQSRLECALLGQVERFTERSVAVSRCQAPSPVAGGYDQDRLCEVQVLLRSRQRRQRPGRLRRLPG
jgi:hypothetical protein